MSHASLLVALEKTRVDEIGLEEALQEQMAPFDENEECFRDGSRWDWYQIGGRFTGMLDNYDPEKDPQNMESDGRVKWPTKWAQHKGDIGQPDTLNAEYKGSYAFLRNRHWHEAERLGWFGGSAKTECEIFHPDDPDKVFGKCLHKDEKTGARVICWNEPWELWQVNFRKRFIEPLPADTVLVNVDYHV